MENVITFPLLRATEDEKFSVQRTKIVAILGDENSSQIFFEGGTGPVHVDTPHDDALECWLTIT